MRNTEKREMVQRIKRLGLFLCVVFVPVLVICVVMTIFKVPQWLNILILILCLSVLYGVFLFICSKLDKRKQNRLNGKKDPFSE